MTFDNKKDILSQNFSAIAPKMVGMTYIYSDKCFLATSRSLYNRITQDFQLPSLETLRRMRSKVSKLNASQKGFIILHDEVHIKKMLLSYQTAICCQLTIHLYLLKQYIV